MDVAIAKIDKFGRIIIPAKWRKELFGKNGVVVLLIKKDHSIELRPIATKNLEEFFKILGIEQKYNEIEEYINNIMIVDVGGKKVHDTAYIRSRTISAIYSSGYFKAVNGVIKNYEEIGKYH